MNDEPQNFLWPSADAETYLAALAVIIGLFVLAILLEVYRRRRERRRLLEAEWRTVHEIAREKRLTPEETRLLERLLERDCAEDPHHGVTVRLVFDRCVVAHMERLRQEVGLPAYEKTGIMLRDIRTKLGLDYIPLGQRIQSTRELAVGQTVWAAAIHDPSIEWHRLTISQVNEAHFHTVKDKAAPMPLYSPGEQVQCRLWREEDARYRFVAKIVRTEEHPPTWIFAHTSDLERVQARSDYRIHDEQSVELAVVEAPLHDDWETARERPTILRTRATVTSLSAGGLALTTQQALPKAVLLRLTLRLEEEDLEVVVRPVAVTEIAGGRRLIRGSFVGLSEETREKIARFVVQHQQRLDSLRAAEH